jgi:ketosteroid isomerase-like protein
MFPMTVAIEKTRTTEEVFNSHREAIEDLDFEKLAADYAQDAVLVTLDGSFVGKEAILSGFFQPIMAQFPDVKITFEKTAFEHDVCLLQWSAEASAMSVPTGTAVFIIQDGLIQRQGEWFQMVLKEG